MNKLLSLLLGSLLAAPPLMADDIYHLVVEQKNGATDTWSLAEKPHITFADGQLTVASEHVETSYALADVKNYHFTTSLTLPSEVVLNISAAEYATLMLPFDAEIPEYLSVYTCCKVNGTTLVLTAVSSIQAGVPYIVKGEYNKYVAPASADGECLAPPQLDVVRNRYVFTGTPTVTSVRGTYGELVGTLEPIKAPAGSYVLQNGSEGVGFYRVSPDKPISVPANRCYLKAQPAGVNVRAFFFPTIADGVGETTANGIAVAAQGNGLYTISGNVQSVTVTAMNGATIDRQTDCSGYAEVNLSGHSAGIYMVNINNRQTIKITKK